MSTPEQTPRKRSDRQQALFIVLAMAAVMWVVEIVDQIGNGSLDRHGIEPHDPDGLIGIGLAPFLHSGFDHLIGNTIPFLVLGAAIALSGLLRVVWATVIIILVGGLGVWIFAPSDTVHVGASGVVFGYATYLIARGVFSRNLMHLAIGVGVIAVYGGTLLFGLVPTPGVSWQGHLFGGVGGVVAARMLDRREQKKLPERPSSPYGSLPA